ncbi:MAG: hypothetical protein OEZ22_01480 [Spirochaetia bacterium]|nr:hypothetical protein [Spirochaetia bacterium]
MIKIILQQDFLIIPETPVAFIIILFLLIIAAFIYFFVKKRSLYSKSDVKKGYDFIYNYAVKHGISSGHLQLIKQFVSSLNSGDIEQIILSKRTFHSKIFDFLAHQKKVSPEICVEIIEKLFPESGIHREVKSIRDLYEGEACSVDVSGTHYLAKIVKQSENNAVLTIPELDSAKAKPGNKINIYLFRPQIGSFQLTGKIIKTLIDAILIQAESSAVSTNDEHLAADIIMPLTLEVWDIENIEKHDQKISVNIVSRKITDRAFLFLLKDENDKNKINQHSFWQTNIKLKNGEIIKLTGKVRPSKMNLNFYIFMFLDISEANREKIFNFIKASSPKRGSIY